MTAHAVLSLLVLAAPAPTPPAKAAPAAPATPATAPARPPENGISVAVFPLEAKHGVPKGAADLVTETLLGELRRANVFTRVVSPSDIALLMPPEQQKFLVRCASDECALVDNELAGALGVSHLIVGNLGKLGSSYLLNLRLLDVRSSVLVASLADRAKGETEEALLDAVKPAVQDLLRQAHLVAPPRPATPEAAPSAGSSMLRKGLWGFAGVSLAAAGVVLVVALACAAGGTAAALYDVAQGWRPGEPHALTATQGLLADLVVGAGAVSAAVALVVALAAGVALGVSGVVP